MESLLSNLQISIPMGQLIALVVISTSLALFGYFKSAVASNFLFVFYWIYQNNKTTLEKVSMNNVFSFSLAGNYTLIACIILFGIGLLIFYEIFE